MTVHTPATDALDEAQALRAAFLKPRADARLIHDQIGELIRIHKNPWTQLEDTAVMAGIEGRPAYWRRTGYSNSAVAMFCLSANLGSITDALANAAMFGVEIDAVLAEVIPLNTAAVDALEFARWNLTKREGRAA